MKMKKAVVVLAAILILSLSACTPTDGEGGSDASPQDGVSPGTSLSSQEPSVGEEPNQGDDTPETDADAEPEPSEETPGAEDGGESDNPAS